MHADRLGLERRKNGLVNVVFDHEVIYLIDAGDMVGGGT